MHQNIHYLQTTELQFVEDYALHLIQKADTTYRIEFVASAFPNYKTCIVIIKLLSS
jgi:hypothetical protein